MCERDSASMRGGAKPRGAAQQRRIGCEAACAHALGRQHHDRGRLVGVLGGKDELAVVGATSIRRVLWPLDDKVPLEDVVWPAERPVGSRESTHRKGGQTHGKASSVPSARINKLFGKRHNFFSVHALGLGDDVGQGLLGEPLVLLLQPHQARLAGHGDARCSDGSREEDGLCERESRSRGLGRFLASQCSPRAEAVGVQRVK